MFESMNKSKGSSGSLCFPSFFPCHTFPLTPLLPVSVHRRMGEKSESISLECVVVAVAAAAAAAGGLSIKTITKDSLLVS